jgi:hypothetical protein
MFARNLGKKRISIQELLKQHKKEFPEDVYFIKKGLGLL